MLGAIKKIIKSIIIARTFPEALELQSKTPAA